ncbi:MAG: UvrD-helicase domain-containing protein [Endozoicomonas sp.]
MTWETRRHNGHYLTDEQNQAVDLAIAGNHLKIEAFAGAGKTSTLAAISEALPGRKGLYLAFNRSLADEAALKFPPQVDCRTAHSLAFRALGHQYKHRLQRLTGGLLARELRLQPLSERVSATGLGNLILDTLTRYCHSGDKDLHPRHAPHSTLNHFTREEREALVEEILPQARQAWELMIDPYASLPVTHDAYLKLWTLSRPQIDTDYLLFDEAQDANGAMLALVQQQPAQQIYVGDPWQQIYHWRGAVNAMRQIDTEHCCRISQSFRFGQPIADMANRILNEHLDAGVQIRGLDTIDSQVRPIDQPDVILCRTNSRLIQVLNRQLEKGLSVAIHGGCRELLTLVKGAQALQAGKRTYQHDLMLFENWQQLKECAEAENSDLASLVRLIERYGADTLIRTLEQSCDIQEDQADLVLSTTHKAKGQEWSKVQLENDFREPGSESYQAEESNLLYVAATRARHELDISRCQAI